MRDHELEQQRLLKIQRESEKEFKIKQTLAEHEKEVMSQNDVFLKTMSQEQMRAQQQKEQTLKNLKKKYIVEMLRMEDAEENNKRLEKVNEYKKSHISEKIVSDSHKIQQFQEEREKAILEKKRFQIKLEMEKAEALKDFEKKKRHLINNKTSMANLSTEILPETSFQQPMQKNTLTTKSQPKLFTLANTKFGTKSFQNFAINKTVFIESHETNIDQSSKSFVGPQKSDRRKESQVRQETRHIEKREERLPKNLRESPYNQALKMNNGAKEKPLPKSITQLPPSKDDAVIMDLQSKEYKKESNITN